MFKKLSPLNERHMEGHGGGLCIKEALPLMPPKMSYGVDRCEESSIPDLHVFLRIILYKGFQGLEQLEKHTQTSLPS